MQKVLINSELKTDELKKFIPLNDLVTSLRTSLKHQLENYIAFEKHGIKKGLVKYNVGQCKLKERRDVACKITKAHHAEEERTVKLKKYIKDMSIFYHHTVSVETECSCI